MMKLRASLALLALLMIGGIAQAAPLQLGDIVLGQTVRCPWPTFDKSGNSATPGTAGTLYVYKDGGTGTVKSVVTDLGGTDTRALGGNAGDHEANFPTTDAFFVAGSDYVVRARGTVVDSQTVNAPLCVFSIENRSTSKYRVRGRGNMLTGSTFQSINLGSSTFAANHVWQGLLFCDLATNECAAICDSADGGGANPDTLTLSGLTTTPISTDAFVVYGYSIPLGCINAGPGAGLPFTDNNGGVTMTRIGASPSTATAFSDIAAANLFGTYNNGGQVFSGTIFGLYTAATLANQHIGTPVDMGSGATLYGNLLDQQGVAHAGTCDSSSTTTQCNFAGLTEADNFWNSWSAIIVFGQPSRCVRQFIAASHRLVFDALPLTAANLPFVLRAAPECRQ